MPSPGQYPRGRLPARCGQGGFRGRKGWRPRTTFRSRKFSGRFAVAGVTRDSTGAPLGGCTVHLFESATDAEVAETTSDGSGNYLFSIGQNAGFFYVVAYKVGSPDLAGTTVNTITAV